MYEGGKRGQLHSVYIKSCFNNVKKIIIIFIIYIIAVVVSLWFLLQRPNKGAGKAKDKQLSCGK
jgi:hypothetical protein